MSNTILEALRDLKNTSRSKNFNEDLKDINFKELEEIEKSAKDLSSEINHLWRDYTHKVDTKKETHDEYVNLKKRIDNLQSHIRNLYDSCKDRSRPHLVRYDDEVEVEYYFDNTRYEKIKHQISQRYDELDKLKNDLKLLSDNIEKEFESEYNNIKNKQTERDSHLNKSKDIRTKIKQSYSELEGEINQVITLLNDYLQEEWKADPKSITYKDGKIQVRLFKKYEVEDIDDIDIDFFDEETRNLSDRYVNYEIEDLINDHIVQADFIIDEFNFKLVENNWYEIPKSSWMLLYCEPDVEALKVPSVFTYEDGYEVEGDFILEASIYIGKKI